MLALTPRVSFAVAVAASAARAPGLPAAGLAALPRNYLFIAPRYGLTFG
jgi:K+-sensing histidine kinase KdpD